MRSPMGHVQLALLWHFHQPCYRDLPSGKILMPWVRLHGIKDYTGMAALLAEFPKIRCTANFSPVLLDQIEAYVGGAADTMLDLSRIPAATLTAEQKTSMLATFFFAHPDTVIGAWPRFREIFDLHRGGQPLREQDFRDLQVLANLAWFHPLLDVEPLRRKGRGFSEEDKDKVSDLTRRAMAAILPAWKALSGRVELSVSPYFHPILPLLCDFSSAREAMPGLTLPASPSFRDEAEVQVLKALEAGERHFGIRPAGMWPSEGSVSQETCALLARHGVKWAATDEAILGQPGVRRVGDLKVAFRDAALSNLLGFTYKTWGARDAAADFVRRLEHREGPVAVVLDGENPWEHYAGGGVEFLRELYRALSDHPTIRTVTMSELEPTGTIDRIFAGSWINRNFGVWIGHEEDRRAWEMLGRARAALDGASPPLAWECLRAAEGSDWFWWFGEDYSSEQDAEFDALFRRHLMNAYRAAGKPCPEDVQRPIKPPRREGAIEPPRDLLSVHVDGRRTDYFEWIAAGRYDMSREYGAISGEAAFIRAVRYGVDERSLFLRLDFRPGIDARGSLEGIRARVHVTRPRPRTEGVSFVVDEIAEAAVPLASLDVQPGDHVEFFLEFERDGGAPLRVPTVAPLWFKAPTAEYREINWHV